MMKDTWFTWHDRKFDCNKYLYHYTSVEKAIKILFNGTLRFAPITKTNDILESKVKIHFSNIRYVKDFYTKAAKIREYMKNYNHSLQLLCFYKDQDRDKHNYQIYTKENDLYAVDMTGRGFSFPRMWAQYGDNNTGVCFVINKQDFETELKLTNMELIYDDNVQYKSVFDVFDMEGEEFENFYDAIQKETAGQEKVCFPNHMEYIRYSFFTKHLDWNNENEYRYLIYSSKQEINELCNLNKFLSGIVLGENIDSVQEWIIQKLAEQYKYDIKKMSFNCNCCRLNE